MGATRRSGSAVWFVTGASRGLGRAVVEAVHNSGDIAVAAVRDPGGLPAVFRDRTCDMVVRADVTDERETNEAVASVLAEFGRIDILVNNAGHGLVGAVEEVQADEVREVFATNVEGLLNVTRAVLPAMRRRQSGHIFNLSSMGGFSASPGHGVYCATKFAVEGLSEALAAELAPFGISVTIVEPGYFRTDFLSETSIAKASNPIPAYDDVVVREVSGRSGRQLGDPAKAAQALLDVVQHKSPPLRLQLGLETVERVQAKIAAVAEEAERWRFVATSTSFAGHQ